MSLLIEVVTQITLPIVALAAAGFGLQKWANFHVQTLNRLLVYATFPCFIIVTLSQATIPLSQVQGTALFTVAQFAVLAAIGWWIGGALKLEHRVRTVVALACAFPNSGNYGIPLVELAFGEDMVIHQVVITSIITVLILIATPVLFAGTRDGGWGSHVKAMFQNPMIPSVAIGLLLNAMNWRLPGVIETPMETLGKAYVGVALFALGAQLAANRLEVPAGSVGLAVALRLLLAPALTGLALLVVPLPGEVKALLFVGATAPVGVLLTIFAAEFKGPVELSSAVVIGSTVVSPLVATAAVVLTRI